jgi:hypothetical protein
VKDNEADYCLATRAFIVETTMQRENFHFITKALPQPSNLFRDHRALAVPLRDENNRDADAQ